MYSSTQEWREAPYNCMCYLFSTPPPPELPPPPLYPKVDISFTHFTSIIYLFNDPFNLKYILLFSMSSTIPHYGNNVEGNLESQNLNNLKNKRYRLIVKFQLKCRLFVAKLNINVKGTVKEKWKGV